MFVKNDESSYSKMESSTGSESSEKGNFTDPGNNTTDTTSGPSSNETAIAPNQTITLEILQAAISKAAVPPQPTRRTIKKTNPPVFHIGEGIMSDMDNLSLIENFRNSTMNMTSHYSNLTAEERVELRAVYDEEERKKRENLEYVKASIIYLVFCLMLILVLVGNPAEKIKAMCQGGGVNENAE